MFEIFLHFNYVTWRRKVSEKKSNLELKEKKNSKDKKRDLTAHNI